MVNLPVPLLVVLIVPLLLRFSNYQKLADSLYISYKRSAKATPELSKEFDAVRTAARKNRKR